MLLEYGHPYAVVMEYTIGQVWDEAELVVDRVNNTLATEAILIQSAIGSALSKDGNKQFSKLIKKLAGEG